MYRSRPPATPVPKIRSAIRCAARFTSTTRMAVPDADMTDLALLPDFDLNRDGAAYHCADATHASKGIRAHSAPLGLSFLHSSNVPAPYRKGAAIALHGCWNCTSLRAGYKVIYF